MSEVVGARMSFSVNFLRGDGFVSTIRKLDPQTLSEDPFFSLAIFLHFVFPRQFLLRKHLLHSRGCGGVRRCSGVLPSDH